MPGILMSDITTRTRPWPIISSAYCGSHVPNELKPRHRSDSCSISTMPGSSSSTQIVIASSELPRTKWPSLEGEVIVFMPDQGHGQCHNRTAHGPGLQLPFGGFQAGVGLL